MKFYSRKDVVTMVVLFGFGFIFLTPIFTDFPLLENLIVTILLTLIVTAMIFFIVYDSIKEKNPNTGSLIFALIVILGLPALLGWLIFESFSETFYLMLSFVFFSFFGSNFANNAVNAPKSSKKSKRANVGEFDATNDGNKA
jgi:uncharacterized membrane protein YfcA